MNKTEICVPIRNEEELQQAKDMLEKNGENVSSHIFNLSEKEGLNYLYYSPKSNSWGLSFKSSGDTEIPLSELESVLKGEEFIQIKNKGCFSFNCGIERKLEIENELKKLSKK